MSIPTTKHPQLSVRALHVPKPRDLTTTILTRGSTSSLKEAALGLWDPADCTSRTLSQTADRYLEARLPAHRAGPLLRHLRQLFRAFPATTPLRVALATHFYGRLPVVLPLLLRSSGRNVPRFRLRSAEAPGRTRAFYSLDWLLEKKDGSLPPPLLCYNKTLLVEERESPRNPRSRMAAGGWLLAVPCQ